MDEQVIEKFLSYVDKTNYCWNWTGLANKAGHPYMQIYTSNVKKYYNPRKLSLDIVGKLLPTSSQIQPLVCRNNLCINPDHLVRGDEARFWSYVQKLPEEDGGCWVWIGSQTKKMYGTINMILDGKKTTVRAHVYAWQLANNHIIQSSNLQVCHICDHPYCVNPAHLFLGTAQDNMSDKVAKNRQAKGSKIGCSKLTEQQVLAIKQESILPNITRHILAKKYNVSIDAIHKILSGKNWKHIV